MPPIPRRSTGIVLALCCLLLLGVMPLISAHRPAGSDGLTFALALTLWQLLFALPLFLAERRQVRPARAAPGRRTLAIALLTGLMFGISTLMYVVAADRADAIEALFRAEGEAVTRLGRVVQGEGVIYKGRLL